jgi:hypothetical protein
LNSAVAYRLSGDLPLGPAQGVSAPTRSFAVQWRSHGATVGLVVLALTNTSSWGCRSSRTWSPCNAQDIVEVGEVAGGQVKDLLVGSGQPRQEPGKAARLLGEV